MAFVSRMFLFWILSFTCFLLDVVCGHGRALLPATLGRIPWEDILLVMHETIKVDLGPLSRSGSRPLLSVGCVVLFPLIH